MFYGTIHHPISKRKRIDAKEVKKFSLDSSTFIYVSKYIDSTYNMRYCRKQITFSDSIYRQYSYKEVRDDIMDVFGMCILESSSIVHRYIKNKNKKRNKPVFLHW